MRRRRGTVNQDFALHATPANARRLLRLAAGDERITVPEELARLAAHDTIGEGCFDHFTCQYNEERRVATQYLLDCGMRAVVQTPYHPSFDETSLLNAVRLSPYRPVTIVTYRRAAWRLPIRLNYLDDTLLAAAHDLTAEQIDARRHGVVVVDVHTTDLSRPSPAARILHEFPRTILYSHGTSLDGMPRWTSLASILFPTMPHPLAIRAVLGNPPSWARKPMSYFAHYYNTCLFPELIKSCDALTHADTITFDSDWI